MSSSEPATLTDHLGAVATALENGTEEILQDLDGPRSISAESLRRIVSAATRLHARFGDGSGGFMPLDEHVSPTEAVDLACALLRARDLNPFDLALWFSRPA